MDGQTRAAAWMMLGAMIGAGFASGRELASFFSRYQGWSVMGIAAALAAIGWLALRALRHPESVISATPSVYNRMRRALFAALMLVTGGAMLSATGELAALVLPMPSERGASALGIVLTMAAGYGLACCELRSLALVSRGLVVCLLCVMAAGLWLPPASAVVVVETVRWTALPEILLRGACYGGLNAALALPALADASRTLTARQKKQCVCMSCAVLGVLLVVGDAVLRRHPALMGEALPFLMMTKALGLWGYGLSALSLYLAMLTTLSACLRGLRVLAQRRWCMLLPLGVALLGFAETVDWLYPVLGGACLLMLGKSMGKSVPSR